MDKRSKREDEAEMTKSRDINDDAISHLLDLVQSKLVCFSIGSHDTAKRVRKHPFRTRKPQGASLPKEVTVSSLSQKDAAHASTNKHKSKNGRQLHNTDFSITACSDSTSDGNAKLKLDEKEVIACREDVNELKKVLDTSKKISESASRIALKFPSPEEQDSAHPTSSNSD